MPGWYPGHMLKARRELQTNLRLVDVVIEIVDARIPVSSRIPDFRSMISSKPSVLALNKADLADPASNHRWIAAFEQQSLPACTVNAVSGEGTKELLALARRQAAAKRGGGRRRLRPFRAMAVGIPNVGKSSLLNRLAGAKSARTGNRPGVTRGRQWLVVAPDLELLDLPGILWPDQSEGRTFLMLCVTGSVSEGGFSEIDAATELLGLLLSLAPAQMRKRYGDFGDTTDPMVLLEHIGRRRGFLITGGQIDIVKAARALLLDYQSGRLGRHTLEMPS